MRAEQSRLTFMNRKHIVRKPRTSAKIIKRIVKKALINNLEDKYICTETAPDNVPTTYLNTGFSLMTPFNINYSAFPGLYAPLTDCHGQLGNEIKLQQLDFGYTLQINVTASPLNAWNIRVFLLYDNEPSTDSSFNSSLVLYNAVANYDDIVLRTPQLTAPYYATEMGKRGSDRFTVIYDKIHKVSSPENTMISVKKRIKLRNKLIKFSQKTGTNTVYPLNGNLLFFITSEGNSIAGMDEPHYETNFRLWYHDA